MVDEGLEQIEKQKSLSEQKKRRDIDTIDLLEDTELVEKGFSTTGTVASKTMEDISTTTSNRPWEASGSRKKLKKHYYTDINALKDRLKKLDTV